jgi:hypothetical protein
MLTIGSMAITIHDTEHVVGRRGVRRAQDGRGPVVSPLVGDVLRLQRLAGNAAVEHLLVQRCGPVPCDCSPEERRETGLGGEHAPVQALPAQRQPDGGQPSRVGSQLAEKVAPLDDLLARARSAAGSRADGAPELDVIARRIARLHEIVASGDEQEQADALSLLSREPPTSAPAERTGPADGELVASRQAVPAPAPPVPVTVPPVEVPWWMELLGSVGGALLLILSLGMILESDTPRRKTCATEYPDAVRCDRLPSQFTYSSPQAALADLKGQLGSPNLRLTSPNPSTGGPCPGVGMHYGVKDGGVYVASISCCPCCEDTPTGPVMRTRCRII